LIKVVEEISNPFNLTSCPYFAKSINVDFVLNILKNRAGREKLDRDISGKAALN